MEILSLILRYTQTYPVIDSRTRKFDSLDVSLREVGEYVPTRGIRNHRNTTLNGPHLQTNNTNGEDGVSRLRSPR